MQRFTVQAPEPAGVYAPRTREPDPDPAGAGGTMRTLKRPAKRMLTLPSDLIPEFPNVAAGTLSGSGRPSSAAGARPPALLPAPNQRHRLHLAAGAPRVPRSCAVTELATSVTDGLPTVSTRPRRVAPSRCRGYAATAVVRSTKWHTPARYGDAMLPLGPDSAGSRFDDQSKTSW